MDRSPMMKVDPLAGYRQNEKRSSATDFFSKETLKTNHFHRVRCSGKYFQQTRFEGKGTPFA